MKALILASGTGSRLLPLTNDRPKCLLDLGGTTILDVQIGHLIACGVRDVVITTGHQANLIEQHVADQYPEAAITLVKNDMYATTNYIYSIWLARDRIDDELLLLHGDVVFERKVLQKLIRSEYPNAVLGNPTIVPPEKDFKLQVEGDRVTQIGVGVHGENTYFCLPVYKLGKAGFSKWLAQIEQFIRRGETTRYAEDAFNVIAEDMDLRPVYYEDEFCLEIDDHDDLRRARDHYNREGV